MSTAVTVHRLIAGTADVQILCGDSAAWPDLVTSRGVPTCPACLPLLEPTTGSDMPPKKSPRRAPPAAAPATEPEVLNQDSVQEDEAQAARVADANARIDKTLGQHVAEAQNRAQKIPWQHGIGSSVLLLTAGQAPKKAVIRNITDQGAFAHYDLNLGGDGGTVDGVEAWRIGRDLDAEGELAGLRERLALEARHRERGREMAQKHFEMEAEDRRLAEVHAAHRTSMRALAAKLAEHVRTDPGQMDLRDIVGEVGDAPHPADESSAAVLARRISGGDVIELADFSVTFDQMRAARLERSTSSTGKPQQVKPVSIGVEQHVLVDVQKGVAVLAPILPRKEWLALYEEVHGPVSDLPSDTENLTGCPVKVGRTTLYLCPTTAWLLVKLPPDLANAGEDEPVASGKDAAAGG